MPEIVMSAGEILPAENCLSFMYCLIRKGSIVLITENKFLDEKIL